MVQGLERLEQWLEKVEQDGKGARVGGIVAGVGGPGTVGGGIGVGVGGNKVWGW